MKKPLLVLLLMAGFACADVEIDFMGESDPFAFFAVQDITVVKSGEDILLNFVNEFPDANKVSNGYGYFWITPATYESRAIADDVGALDDQDFESSLCIVCPSVSNFVNGGACVLYPTLCALNAVDIKPHVDDFEDASQNDLLPNLRHVREDTTNDFSRRISTGTLSTDVDGLRDYVLVVYACYANYDGIGIDMECQAQGYAVKIYDCRKCGGDICIPDQVSDRLGVVQEIQKLGRKICTDETTMCRNTDSCEPIYKNLIGMDEPVSGDLLDGIGGGLEGVKGIHCEKDNSKINDPLTLWVNDHLVSGTIGAFGQCSAGATVPKDCDDVFGDTTLYRWRSDDDSIEVGRFWGIDDKGNCVIAECAGFLDTACSSRAHPDPADWQCEVKTYVEDEHGFAVGRCVFSPTAVCPDIPSCRAGQELVCVPGVIGDKTCQICSCEQRPPVINHCINNLFDPYYGELAVDCGGECPPCISDPKCDFDGICEPEKGEYVSNCFEDCYVPADPVHSDQWVWVALILGISVVAAIAIWRGVLG